ncbi:MAG: peptidoglycan-associated lipoprotein Pal [Pseudomonadota bacterium]
MRLKLLSLFASLLLVAACGTSGDQISTADSDAAQTSGPSYEPGSEEEFIVEVGDRVFFGYNAYDLTTEAQDTLSRQAEWLNTYPDSTILVEGHADERGTREYNLALGEQRGNAVKNYLVAVGIDASRVEVISYGKERPAVVGSNEGAWSRNRRGVSVIN